MRTTDSARLRTALQNADFPATKDDLVASAKRAEADGETVRVLEALQPETYENLAEVERSVTKESGRSERDRAEERRQHTKPGVAQQEKDVSEHPIVAELGENRDS